jgi:hypothetical protein
LTGGLKMVMSATPSAPTSMVTRIDPAMAPAQGPRDRSIGGRERERERGRVGRGKREESTSGSNLHGFIYRWSSARVEGKTTDYR